MNVEKRDLVLAAGAFLLVAVGVVRTAMPDRYRLRPLSVQGMDIVSEPIGTRETLTREVTWSPPVDVYVMGWSYRIGGFTAGGELSMFAGTTRLFEVAAADAPASNPSFFQNGAGFLLRQGDKLTLRYRLTNTGPPGQTRGAGALVYFVPVEGN